jgi:hypothetical protein
MDMTGECHIHAVKISVFTFALQLAPLHRSFCVAQNGRVDMSFTLADAGLVRGFWALNSL